MRKIGAAILIVVASAAIGSGCSSSDKDAEAPATTTTAKPSITKAEFIAQADKLCSAAQAKISEMPLDPNASTEVIAAALLDQVPIQRQLMEDLRALPLPAGEATTLGAIFDQVDTTLDNIESGLKTDPAAVISGPNPFDAANRAAAEYGFEACSE